MDAAIGPVQFMILVFAGFFAGLVDSMAGGGGLISLPALVAAGVSPHFALGTNKVQSCFGTTISTLRYLKGGHMQALIAGVGAVAALIGSYLGALVALSLPSDFLGTIMPFLIGIVAIVTFARKGFGESGTFSVATPRGMALAALVGGTVGFYDGFFGPGTGTFLTFAYVVGFGFSFLQASANAKLANWASNIAAVAAFALDGKVLWGLAFAMAAANIVGNYIGSGLAMKKGSVIIKPAFGFVLGLLFIKIAFWS